ncbi:MAG: hypothetical protein LBV06_04980 [Propionibacteriaceae bacterium]|nr:hypothetical protein [Propionibacteriaceae bacterium]
MISTLDDALAALLDFAVRRGPDHDSVAVERQALSLLGDPQRRLRVIHVTGTSGKTSTCHFLQGLLQACGRRTGMTVSPHISAINERVQIDGRPLEPRQFCADVEHVLDRLTPLRGVMTYFEVVIALAWWVFAREQVDDAIVEVGIGGLHDATNVVDRLDKVAVIGPIGLDHTEVLGDTVTQVAAQKAGIIGPGNHSFVLNQDESVLEVVRRRAEQVQATVTVVEPDPARDLSLPVFQRTNWAMARHVVAYLARRDGFLEPTPDQVEVAKTMAPPARFERFDVAGHEVVLDGAHNPQKMDGLARTLRGAGYPPMPTLATLSRGDVTKVEATVAALKPLVTTLIIPEFVLGRADLVKESIPASVMADQARRLGVSARIVSDLDAGLDALLAQSSRRLLITGSLYLAGLVRPRLIHWER